MCHREECQRFLKTGLSRINLADARHQVVQVGFGALEHIVIARAVLAPTVLPALALVPDLPGRNNMLPLDARGAAGVLAGDITAGLQVHAVAGVFAAAIELGGLRRIELPGDFLGFAEGSGRLRVGGNGKKQAAQSNKTGTHRINLPSAQPRKSARRHRRDKRG